MADLSQVDRESAKLYAILQGSVDREIQEVGFIPDGNGSWIDYLAPPTIIPISPKGEQWACSDKQRDLILKIVDEHKLDKLEVEGSGQGHVQRPGQDPQQDGREFRLIAELISKYGPTKSNGGNGRRPYQRGGAR